jgi:hypothetical protein
MKIKITTIYLKFLKYFLYFKWKNVKLMDSIGTRFF